MKHHLSALKGSSVTGYQSPLSSDPFRVKTCRARSVSGSFQEVRFSFLRLQRRLSPRILRWTTSSFSAPFRHLRGESILGTRKKHKVNSVFVENSDYSPNLTVKRCILDEVRKLQQVSTQVGEHCRLQLHTADLLGQTQIRQTVIWAEFICEDGQAPGEEGLGQEIAADLQSFKGRKQEIAS